MVEGGKTVLTINHVVAKRIKKLLQEREMTQYRLKRESGLTHGALDGILTERNKTVTLTTVYKLARAFDMTVYEFMDDELFRSEDLEID